MKRRWEHYFMRYGEGFIKFWEEYLQNNSRDILYILGKGFDPRMCEGYDGLLKAGGAGKRDCLLIEFDEGPHSPSQKHASRVSKNLELLNNLYQGHGKLLTKSVQMWSDEGFGRRRIGSRSAAEVFSDVLIFADYTDVVIDISALPRGIFFPLIGKAMYVLEEAKKNNNCMSIPNLHIVVCENVNLDRKIQDVGIDDTASYIHGFTADLEMEATSGIPRVWIPILGEGQHGQLERIHTLVSPDEICPVLPAPSLNPRRGDELLIEYRKLLFDQWLIEPRNIIYASEQNPFEAYRQIHKVVCHYNKALKPLGSCKVAVSALSSKLLSIGALLVAYELKMERISIGIAHVETQGYDIDKEKNSAHINDEGKLFILTLTGDGYEL